MPLIIEDSDVAKITGLSAAQMYDHQRRKADLIGIAENFLPKGGRLLDVGCASGDISIELAAMGYLVHGIDFEPVRLNRARWLAEKYGQRVTFTVSSFYDLDTLTGFNGIILGEVLEHFSDPEDILKKAARFLDRDGKIIVTTPNMPSLNNRLKFLALGIFPDNNPEHRFYFDKRRFAEVVNKTELSIELFETKYTGLQNTPASLKPLEQILFGWFTRIFKLSGDTIFAVLSK